MTCECVHFYYYKLVDTLVYIFKLTIVNRCMYDKQTSIFMNGWQSGMRNEKYKIILGPCLMPEASFQNKREKQTWMGEEREAEEKAEDMGNDWEMMY